MTNPSHIGISMGETIERQRAIFILLRVNCECYDRRMRFAIEHLVVRLNLYDVSW